MVPEKDPSHLRFVTFNVNGIKTLFNYHPWNQCRDDLGAALQKLNADVVSLQELKINQQQHGLTVAGQPKNYRSFVSIPRSKTGYSGVGLYVRVPKDDDTPQVKASLTVIKAEEGITGMLPSAKNKNVFYKDSDGIGGYVDDDDLLELGILKNHLVNLDSQGRAAVVELASNTVVFSVYCPANSGGTEEGQEYRVNFLKILFRRCELLCKKHGKKVVVMGDINVSPDLIDNAEAMNELIKRKVVKNNLRDGPLAFEMENSTLCMEFRDNSDHRRLLNSYLHPTMPNLDLPPSAFLFDTTRLVQKRRLNMYTVWNTITNARQSNYGSRIDLILSSEGDSNISHADILPHIRGSDHCPVFTDFTTTNVLVPHDLPLTTILPFEAASYYNLVTHRDISSMFARSAKLPITTSGKNGGLPGIEPPKKKPHYVSRKKHSAQPSIKSFFFQTSPATSTQETKKPLGSPSPPVSTSSLSSETNIETPLQPPRSGSPSVKLNSPSAISDLTYPNPPFCRHGDICNLKTSLTKTSKGRKFWCCPRTSKGSTLELGDHRCDFFEWAKTLNS